MERKGLTEQDKEKQKTTRVEELQKVESKEVQQSRNSLKETLVDSSNVYAVRKGIVSGSSVQQVRSEIDQMVSASSVQQARSQIEQPKPQQKEKPQNQK
jgi:fructose-1,6-bisphosphatase/sedoheptulose 1,7-bisphosphatase-like protein